MKALNFENKFFFYYYKASSSMSSIKLFEFIGLLDVIIVFVSLGLLIEFVGGVLKNPPPPLPLLVLNMLLSL
jgi:hypothetical protein